MAQRLTMRGFTLFDWADRVPQAIREDVRTGGIDAYPDVLNLLCTGGNNGKLVLRV